jgi:hypothetical protein
MRRALPLIPLVLLAVAPAAAQASAPASVKLTACVPALAGVDRAATFEARVSSSRGSARMQVRFTLQVRTNGAAWRRVAAPGLDQWISSDPGVRRYSYAKTVTNLVAPASYRTVVRFRWLAASGRSVRHTRVTSASCRQPDMRPDLTAPRIDVQRGADAKTRSYVVAVRNGGRAAAGAFDVRLQIGDVLLAPLTVTDLGVGERRMVTFTAPRCTPGAPLVATVDTGAAVDERDENDNVLAAACPAR